jgi:hypothetical protein
VIKLSILWDEKRLTDLNSDEVLKEFMYIYNEYQKEIAATSVATGCLFIGLATENDTEFIKGLLNLPVEIRSRLLDYIHKNFKTEPGTMNDVTLVGKEDIIKKQGLKDLLLASPHKDVEILMERPNDAGRDILI